MSDVAVVKIGGSLFDYAPLPQRLQTLLKGMSAERIVLIAGGGAAADLIRAADRLYDLSEETSHALCVAQLDVSAALLHAILPEAMLIDHCDVASLTERIHVLAPQRWLSDVPSTELPRSWSVTTDTIAALYAHRMGANELVLVKSTDPPSDDLHAWSVAGFVDQEFPRFAANLPHVRCVNLRTV